MRGDNPRHDSMFSYVTPEARVRADHPLRPIRRMTDAALEALSPRFDRLYAPIGRPSKPGVERLPMDKIEKFAPIPVQPMSYRDGVELLKRLKGPVAPEAWRGALPITYHVGAGPAHSASYTRLEVCIMRLTTKPIRKRKNRILAMPANADAAIPNPKIAATMAMTSTRKGKAITTSINRPIRVSVQPPK